MDTLSLSSAGKKALILKQFRTRLILKQLSDPRVTNVIHVYIKNVKNRCYTSWSTVGFFHPPPGDLLLQCCPRRSSSGAELQSREGLGSPCFRRSRGLDQIFAFLLQEMYLPTKRSVWKWGFFPPVVLVCDCPLRFDPWRLSLVTNCAVHWVLFVAVQALYKSLPVVVFGGSRVFVIRSLPPSVSPRTLSDELPRRPDAPKAWRGADGGGSLSSRSPRGGTTRLPIACLAAAVTPALTASVAPFP